VQVLRNRQPLPFFQLGLFNIHVFEFAGFEDVTAFQAFDEFGVVFAGDDFHARVLALCDLAAHTGSWAGVDGFIDPGRFPGIGGIFSWKRAVVKHEMQRMGAFCKIQLTGY